ncbi:MAG: hypothetical protein P5683_09445, partial [Limnospira sp. PMC 1279.21]|nr:hypothetical protein [Limnospira sp. PMC 1279.21]
RSIIGPHQDINKPALRVPQSILGPHQDINKPALRVPRSIIGPHQDINKPAPLGVFLTIRGSNRLNRGNTPWEKPAP